MTTMHKHGSLAASSVRSQTNNTTLPGIVITYIMILTLPIEFSFYAGPLLITPIRLFLLIIALPLIILLISREKLTMIDWLLIAYVLWVVLAYLVKRGGGGIQSAGQSFLEMGVSYLVARLFLKEPRQAARLIMMICVIIGILGLLAIPESVLGKRYLHDIPQMLTGINYVMQADTRMGLLRAASTFENPILFGLFSATFLSLLWYSTLSLGTRLVLATGVIMSTSLSLSSAPLLLLVLQIFLIVAEHASRRIRRRSPIIMCTILAMMVFIETFSNRGVARLIASELTFNSHTGYYRLLQWEHSIDDVYANPVFGINFENWTRPYWLTDSIDNHWLLLAMNSGVPAVFMILTALALLAFRLYRRRKGMRDPILKSLMLGWILGMSALFLGGWTVALFGKMMPILFFLVGLGAALLQMPDLPLPKDAPNPDPEQEAAHNRYSRFVPQPGRQSLRRAGGKPAVAAQTTVSHSRFSGA